MDRLYPLAILWGGSIFLPIVQVKKLKKAAQYETLLPTS